MERMASQSKKTGPPLSLSKDSGYSGSLKDKLQSPVSSWKAEDTDCILRHFRFLKDEIYIKPLVDLFFQDGDLDEDDMEEILGQRSRRNSVDIFVRKFLRLNADSFGRFLIYLRKTEQTHIADSLTQEHIVIEDLPDTNLSKHDMETSILMNLELLCDDLEPDKVADYFLQYRVFTIDEYESIISHRTRRKKAVEMVGLILENLPKSFLVLKHIYREKGKYLMLYSLHDVRTSENQSEINTSIREQLEMKRRDVHCTCMLYPPGFFNAKMRLHADHQQSSGFEKNIVDSLQNKVEEINEELRKMSNCKIVLVKSGSIVIYLLSCGPMLRQNNNIKEDVDTLLKVMFNHPAVATFGCYNGLRFNVTVEKPVQECFDQQRMTGILTKETLERNRDFIIEELSAVPFLRHEKASEVFKKFEIDSVLNGTSFKRESRMHALLSVILRKGDQALRFFEMVLRDENQTKIINRLCHGDIEMDTSPTGSYEALIDEMSPSLIADECMAIGLDITRIVEKENILSRKQVCERILEYALSQEHDTKQKFLWVFGKNYPDQVDFGATSSIKMSSKCNSYDLLKTEEDTLIVVYRGKHKFYGKEFEQTEIEPEHLTTKVPFILDKAILDDDISFKQSNDKKKNEKESEKKLDLESGVESDINLKEVEFPDISRSLRSEASSGYCTDRENIYPTQKQSQNKYKNTHE